MQTMVVEHKEIHKPKKEILQTALRKVGKFAAISTAVLITAAPSVIVFFGVRSQLRNEATHARHAISYLASELRNGKVADVTAAKAFILANPSDFKNASSGAAISHGNVTITSVIGTSRAIIHKMQDGDPDAPTQKLAYAQVYSLVDSHGLSAANVDRNDILLAAWDEVAGTALVGVGTSVAYEKIGDLLSKRRYEKEYTKEPQESSAGPI